VTSDVYLVLCEVVLTIRQLKAQKRNHNIEIDSYCTSFNNYKMFGWEGLCRCVVKFYWGWENWGWKL